MKSIRRKKENVWRLILKRHNKQQSKAKKKL